MKIIKVPFETVCKCDLCGCEFEIEQDDLSCEKTTVRSFDGDVNKIIISLYVDCPFCNNQIDIKRKMDEKTD